MVIEKIIKTSFISNQANSELIVFDTFKNGQFTILNVPFNIYIQDSNKKQNKYLKSQTLQQIANMLDYMERYDILTMNFSYYSIMFEKLQLDVQTEQLNQDDIINYVKNEWLKNYKPIQKMLKNVTADSDETIKIKELKNKIKHLEKCIDSLPPLYKTIIQKKYLSNKNILDDVLYQELNLSKMTFYRKQRKALYSLGIALLTISKFK